MSPSTPPPSRPGLHAGDERPLSPNTLAAAHARFARAALTIYLATAAVSVALLLVSLVTDQAHEEDQTREQLLLETDVRAQSLAQRLNLLVEELRRLSQRSEVDLRDQDLSPEKSLLQLSHERSAFFNVGVAILDRRGDVIWSEPSAFLERGVTFAHETWFTSVQRSPAFRIVPVQPDRPDSVLYVVSPLIKGQEFTGALLGAIDLARGQSLSAEKPTSDALTVVATADGEVVYPPVPPPFASSSAGGARSSPAVRALHRERRARRRPHPGGHLAGRGQRARAHVGRQPGGPLPRGARRACATGSLAGLSLALLPAVLLLLLLQRSLKVFRRSEEDAVREERLRLLGEAANSIAHEVKNALNGLSMGLDLVVRTTMAIRCPRAGPAGPCAGPSPPSGASASSTSCGARSSASPSSPPS